jgi:hypothetical protein
MDTTAVSVPEKIRHALGQLAEAYDYARSARQDAWEFAIEMSELLASGLTTSDLRWLASKNYAEHGVEMTQARDARRSFVRNRNMAFRKETCFILTDEGAALAASLGVKPLVVSLVSHRLETPRRELREPGGLRPHWDGQRRLLRMGKQIVKCFRVPAPNQQMILDVFQEEAWPQRISDPLPPLSDLDPKRRLHDTIKCLNRNQPHRMILFRGDGTGEGVVWERMEGVPDSEGTDHRLRAAA